MKIRSCLDNYITIDINFCAATIICRRKHAQLIGEWVDREGIHMIEIADLSGKKSFPTSGTVKTKEITPEQLKHDAKSKTWRIASEYFFRMWDAIKKEEYNEDSHAVYFTLAGSASIFGKNVTDLIPKDPELRQIKNKDPQLFFQICREARKFKSKNRNFAICKIDKLWECGFRLVKNIGFECGMAISDSLSLTKEERVILAHKLLNKVSEMFKAKEIEFIKVRAHNCASWVFAKLQIAEIKTNKPFWSFVAWNPIRYIKINQLTKKEKSERVERRIKKIGEKNKNSSEELQAALMLDIIKPLFESIAKWQSFLKKLNELNQTLDNKKAIVTPIIRKKKKCPCIVM